MEIKFDKALLWGLPYLYLVSITYYWGYWGTFDIDSFNYYAVSDIVKGVTGPIGSVLFFLIVSFLFIAGNKLFGKELDKATENINIKWWARAMLSSIANALFIGIIAILYRYLLLPFLHRHPSPEEEITLFILNVIPYTFVFIINEIIYKDKNLPTKWIFIALAVLPFRSFLVGKETALLVEQNKEFDYIVVETIPNTKKSIYKFLGKAGDYYLLLTTDNLQRIAVPTSVIVPLVIENYSLMDTASVIRFKAHKKELDTLSSHHTPFKQPVQLK